MTDVKQPADTQYQAFDAPSGGADSGLDSEAIVSQFRFEEEAAAQQAVLDAMTPQHLANLRESSRPASAAEQAVSYRYRGGLVRRAGHMATRAAEYVLNSGAGFSAK